MLRGSRTKGGLRLWPPGELTGDGWGGGGLRAAAWKVEAIRLNSHGSEKQWNRF